MGMSLAAGLAATSGTSVLAELVAYDPFLSGTNRGAGEYTAGMDLRTMGPYALGFAPGTGETLDGFGQSWAGTSGNWQANAGGEDSAVVEYEAGGRVQWIGVGNFPFDRNVTRQLKTGQPASGEWWTSIMVNRLSNGWVTTGDPTYVVGGFTDAAGNGLQVGYDDSDADGDPSLVLRVNGSNTVLSPTTNSSDNIYVLMQLIVDESGDDTINYWIDPDTLNPAPTADGSLSVALTDSLTPFSQFKFESPGQSGVAYFDEIRLGTTFESVTGVPEPTTLALLGLGGLAALRRRSRA